jgi:hypothetical protein
MRRRDFCKDRGHSWQVRAVFYLRKCGRMCPTICGRASPAELFYFQLA